MSTDLLPGLTTNSDETPALSVLMDAQRELEALYDVLCLPCSEPIAREALVTLLDGANRRFQVGIDLVQCERADLLKAVAAAQGGAL